MIRPQIKYALLFISGILISLFSQATLAHLRWFITEESQFIDGSYRWEWGILMVFAWRLILCVFITGWWAFICI